MTLAPLDWLLLPPAEIDGRAVDEARARQARLTKPPGALGRLEELAIRLAGLHGTSLPGVDPVRVVVFAGDHGVMAEGVSAFPQAVTMEMIRNFSRGGAAISVLARELGMPMEVVNLGTVTDPGLLTGVINVNLGPGTANFTREPAMSGEQLIRALNVGRETAGRAQGNGCRLFIGGEMGIGNTTVAAALACALLDASPGELAGPGTGLDAAGVARKVGVIQRGLDLHRAFVADPRECLRRLGGFELAALAGAFVTCAQMGVPVLVDGFIASVAALVAERLCPGVVGWFFFAHVSAEPGHGRVLAAFGVRPLLDLGMRLGEGSGAAVALPLLRLACALHNGMATFGEAGIMDPENRTVC